jgi:hypothetical protein
MLLLTDLKEKLETLPQKRQLKILAGAMKKFGELVTQAGANLKSSVDGATLAQAVFPDADFSKVLARIRQAVALAAKLKKRFAEDMTSVAKTASENDITRLGEQATAARIALKEQWQQLLSERIEPHKRLVQVVREIPELAPQGGTKLGNLLDELGQQVSRVPTTQKEAKLIRASLDDLPQVIQNLGLEGEVGEFLVEAASGIGDPKKLYFPAIRTFFEQKKLWGLLRVKVR